MRSERAWFLRLFALLTALVLVFAACGGDDDDDDTSGGGTQDTSDGGGEAGGEVIDLGTFPDRPPDHIDPALNVTVDAYQVVNALYDGLTEIDMSTDPDNPTAEPLVAESWESNDDASVWTFKIKDGLTFSDGEPVLPSSFVRAWERASDPDFAGSYSYLFNFIQGGAEKLDGTAETLAGVVADDDAMTLETTLSAPYGNWPYVAGFQLFMPMPSAVDALADQTTWENGMMIGNGPYKLETPRTDQEIVLVRNDAWGGDIFGNTSATLDKLTFRVSGDVDSAYNAFEAGEGDLANIPPGRYEEANTNYETTSESVFGTVYFEINWKDPLVGGPENVKLRQAILQAVDREEISQAVYEGYRKPVTGVTPAGIPGYEEGLCDLCTYDPEGAEASLQEWKDEGHSQTEPIRIQFNSDSGWEPVVQIIVDNLSAIGIQAEGEPYNTDDFFQALSDGECQICRSGWYADYPTYDNFTYDLFHTDSAGGNNHSFYSNPEFDSLVEEAKAEPDAAKAGELYRQAESLLLNDDAAVLPLVSYVGDYAYNGDKITHLEQTPLGLILYEQVTVAQD
jgi:oligopeptide transport system substrate-binding protein